MLQKQVLNIPIAGGVDTKTDELQVAAGKSLTLENARFFKSGKLQKRFGYSPLLTASDDGDLTDHQIQSIVADNNSIHALTTDGVYALSPSAGQWEKMSKIRDRVKLKVSLISKSTLDQFNPDTDYNSGLIATVYRESIVSSDPTGALRENIVVVLEDVSNGTKKIRKISPLAATDYRKSQQKVMLTIYNGEPRITIIFDSGSQRVKHIVLDKNLDDLIAENTIETLTLTNMARQKMDICRDGSNIFHFILYGTTLILRKLGLDGSIISSSTKTLSFPLGYESASDSALGASMCQTIDRIHVAYITTTTPGVITSNSLISVGYDKSLGTAISETFFSGSFTSSSLVREVSIVGNGTEVVYVLTVVTAASYTLIQKLTSVWSSVYTYNTDVPQPAYRVMVISRPFVINGVSYCVCKCPEVNQPTGIIVNLDNEQFADIKRFIANFSIDGLSKERLTANTGFYTGTSNTAVNSLAVYTAIERLFAVDTNTVGSIETIASITIARLSQDFSTGISSGTRVKVGETNYFTDGPTMALDGRGAYESGFLLRPHINSVTSDTSGGITPGVSSKNFSYKVIYTFFNSKGEIERSGESDAVSVATAANTTAVKIIVDDYVGSYKTALRLINFNPVRLVSPQIDIYRTLTGGSTYYKVLTYEARDVGGDTVYDAVSDTDLANNEILYTSGGVLESDPAPNAKFSTAGGNRLFLGGLEQEDEIAYSKKQIYGEAVAFSNFFRVRISSGTTSDKTKLSALGYLDGKLVIFRENSIYYIAGDGPLETGAQDTFTEPEVISSDTGCIEPRSVINYPNGLLFKSKKGIYALDRSFQVSYIGAEVEDYNSQGIVSAIISDKYNEARFYTDGGNCLVFNYLFNAWSVFTDQTSIDADVYSGNPVQLIGGKVQQEAVDSFVDVATPYAMKVKTSWIKLNGLQDFGRIWSATVIGKYKSAHNLIVKVRYDYNSAYVETFTFTPSITDAQYQYRCHLRKQKCEAVQFEIYDSAQSGESMEISGIALEVGVRSGSMKLPATRKS